MSIPDHIHIVVSDEHRRRIQWAIHDEVRTALYQFAHRRFSRETLQVIRAKVNDIVLRRASELDLTHWYVDIHTVDNPHRPDLNVDLQAPRYEGPHTEPTLEDTFLGWYLGFDLWRVTLRSGQGVLLALGEGTVVGRAMATEVAANRYKDLPKG